jgi:hypothetical protein
MSNNRTPPIRSLDIKQFSSRAGSKLQAVLCLSPGNLVLESIQWAMQEEGPTGLRGDARSG